MRHETPRNECMMEFIQPEDRCQMVIRSRLRGAVVSQLTGKVERLTKAGKLYFKPDGGFLTCRFEWQKTAWVRFDAPQRHRDAYSTTLEPL